MAFVFSFSHSVSDVSRDWRWLRRVSWSQSALWCLTANTETAKVNLGVEAELVLTINAF